tara:strand:+ start:975 stop:2885 length:1911 start_codon:yes stop_codon:yes gene_type:complete
MIIATAGHIDHGKTELVKVITGTNTDRLPEEKSRGMSIDLGFAYLDLNDRLILGFIDVPGHERFISNMIAGISGIDFGLLVIAADDGPMPQTIEHLAIFQLLGVKNCAIAITKIDKVTLRQLEQTNYSVKKLISKTNFSKAKIFPVSSKTKKGLNFLINYLKNRASNLKKEKDEGYFRLSIDRSFLIKGSGIVITGTVISGKVNLGDKLVHSASGYSVTIRKIRSQSKESEIGYIGQRCSLNITGRKINLNHISRGDWILAKEVCAPTKRLDAVLTILKNEVNKFKHWTPVHLYLGTGKVTCRISILQNSFIPPGGNEYVQIIMSKPVYALFGDRFVIRDISSTRTIGGGSIIDPFAESNFRNKNSLIQKLRLMSPLNHQNALNNLINHNIAGIDLELFSTIRNLTFSELENLLKSIDIDKNLFKEKKWGILKKNQLYLQQIIINELYKQQKLKHNNGIKHKEVISKIGIEIPDYVSRSIFQECVKLGKLKKSKNLYFHPSNFYQISNDLSWWIDLEQYFKNFGYQPPKINDLSKEVGIDLKELEEKLKRACGLRLLTKIAGNRYILTSTINEIGFIMEEIISTEENLQISIKRFSKITGISRNLSVEILEFFDKIGFTKRTEKGRIIKNKFEELK